MNRAILKEELKKYKINSDYYSLTGGLPNESFCLDYNNKWEVYYSERGIKSQLVTFETEDEACRYFLGWILKTVK